MTLEEQWQREVRRAADQMETEAERLAERDLKFLRVQRRVSQGDAGWDGPRA